MEIVKGVYALPWGRAPFMGLSPPNVYLVRDQKTALIDAGHAQPQAAEARLRALRQLGLSGVDYLALTHAHPDHAGGADLLCQATGARLAAHPEEASPPGAICLHGGQSLDLGGLQLLAIHTPGHSPGHLCFFLEERGILFSGDHILGLGTTVILPPEGDMGCYMESLERLLDYPITMILPGHGPAIRQPRRKIEELLQHRREREAQVLDCLRRGQGTAEEMVPHLYPELEPCLASWAQGQVQAHLIKLEREGKLARLKGEG
ncbi:MAG TPA: MBL fold metallo-hydrolase [Dehalococcoidia bacterium]|nr:MBL fold metallo-hydrolase [Dehalococcoidia bacterium]